MKTWMTKLSKFFIEILAMAMLIGVPLGVMLYVESKTYVVYEVWPAQKVVKILDPQGREVKPESVDLRKVSYNVVWVSPNYK